MKSSNLIGATFLVAGTCIGGGMLALPVDSAPGGFFPSFLNMIVSWVFMTLTALLLVEVAIWMEEGTHYMTMASRLLGKPGKYISLFLFLFMAYLSMVAYTTGGSLLLQGVFQGSSFVFEHLLAVMIFSLLFGSLFLLGTVILGRINALLVTGMIIAYLGLITFGVGEIQPLYLLRSNLVQIFPAFPIFLTIFSFQMIVPSLVPYLQRDAKRLRKAIIFGTSIPLVVYLLWQLVILGSVPYQGEFGLKQALFEGKAATEPFRNIVKQPYLIWFADFFSFFAVTTSYLGVGLGLFDFLADSLKLTKKGWRKGLLVSMIVVPSIIISIAFPRAFILLLEITGGYGDTILNGLLPISMVYAGRYIQKRESEYQLFGGKSLLIALALFGLFVIGIQTINLLSY